MLLSPIKWRSLNHRTAACPLLSSQSPLLPFNFKLMQNLLFSILAHDGSHTCIGAGTSAVVAECWAPAILGRDLIILLRVVSWEVLGSWHVHVLERCLLGRPLSRHLIVIVLIASKLHIFIIDSGGKGWVSIRSCGLNSILIKVLLLIQSL